MAPSKPALALAIPWLYAAAAGEGGRFPALESLLGGGRPQRECPDEESALLWRLFGREDPAPDVPVGALSRFAEGGSPFDGCWFRADPVHLVADRDRVLLTGRIDDLDEAATAAIVDDFNAVFGGEDWSLEAGPAGWRLKAPAAAIATTPLAAAVGRDVYPRLPEGPDRLAWHRFMNEIQMFLHTHPVNRERERAHRPPVSGLWLWGGGPLPAPGAARWSVLYADGGWAAGLARRDGVQVRPLPGDAAGVNGSGDSLVLFDPADAGQRRLEAAEHWCAPLLDAAVRRRWGRVDIYPGGGLRLALRRGWRWWRRRRALAEVLR